MSDWRQSDSGKSKKKKQPKLKSPKPIASVPSKTPAAPKSTGGWRGKKGAASKSTKTAAPAATRSWTGATPGTEGASTFALKRWLIVITLLVTASVLTVYFIITVFYKPKPLPLYVFSVGAHESSPELLENPYGNYQRAQFKTVNPINVSDDESTQNGNDNALSTLNSPAWIERFERIQSETLSPGGPDRKIVTFYISSYAAFTPDDSLVIYPQGTSPFGGASGLKLEDALSSVASRTKKNNFAWIVLDLQLPPVIANLGDLDPQWASATEKALSKVEEDLRKRLLVTLPCGDGERNWLAPEYSSSFFGHFFRQLLDGRYAKTTLRKIINPDLRIGEFHDLLNPRVSNEVANRRYARQTPVWLPKENLERAKNIKVVTIGKQKDEFRPELNVEPSQLSSIDDLWSKLETQCKGAYRWDPLGYSRVESQLLALEEVALNQPASFLSAKRLVEKAMDELNRPTIGLQVSLTEDTIRERYFHGEFVPKLSEIDRLATRVAQDLSGGASEEQLPSFWRTPVPEGTEDPNKPAANAGLSPTEKPFFVWRMYLAGAESNNAAAWEALFQRERLQAAVDYAGDSSWIEIFLLKRLITEIDWSVSKRSRPQACAKALILFSRLQKLAAGPEPEVSWWLRNDEDGLPPVEEQFLRGFDRLLASETDEAAIEFDQVAARLEPVEETAARLSTAISNTHEALHAIPHLLAWLLKENQFASEQDRTDIQSNLRDLGQMTQLTSEIYPYLMRRPGGRLDDGMLTTSDALGKKLAGLQRAFNQYVDTKTNWKETGGASVNAQTFRRGRIALLNPFISLDARRRLHENTLEFLKMDLDSKRDEVEQSSLPQRSSKLACDEFFLKQIESQRERWESIAKADARFNIEGRFGESEMPAADEPLKLRSELLRLEYWQRAGAVAYGHSPSLHDRLANANRADNLEGARWPWSCPWQRWNLSVANERLFQVERLSSAMWGNGSYNQSSLPTDFYFYQLCGKTKLPSGFTLLKPANQLADSFESTMKSMADSAAKKLLTIRPQFGSEGQKVPTSGTIRAPISVRGESINAIAQVYLGIPGARLPWLRNSPEERTWVADLNEPAEQTQTFDASHWKSGPPLGTLAVRGNVRTEPVRWKVEAGSQPTIDLALTRDPTDGAIIRVLPPKEPPPVTVLLLIDCSNSMDTSVQYMNEKGELAKTPLFNLVKQNLIGVLERLQQIHANGEANVKVGLMPFGLNGPLDPKLRNFLVVWPKNYYKPKLVKQLDLNWFADLKDIIEQDLKPSGDTPLYDVIHLATEQAPQNEKTLIYVFSDGVNWINKPEDRALAKSDLDVRRAIQKNPQLRLNIFHFDYFETWIQGVAPEFHDRWAKIFQEGEAELEELRSLGEKQYGYYRSNQANKLMQDSLASIPRSMVQVTSLDSSQKTFDSGPLPIGEKIHVPQEFLPASLLVEVTGNGNFESASIEVEALGGEEMMLPYDSRGRFVLERFNTRIAPLTCNQPVGSNLSSKLYVRTLNDRVDNAKELGFELHFWNGSQTEFTRRPRFVVAEVATSKDPGLSTFVLADHRFTPATLFPEARLSEVPWPGGSRQPARLRVWAADSLPKSLNQKLLKPDDVTQVKIGKATIDYSHKGDRLVAEVGYESTPRAQDRVVLICPDFEVAQRKFLRDTNKEIHEFTLLPDKQNQATQLQWTTIGLLEEAAEAGEVTQCNFEEINLRY